MKIIKKVVSFFCIVLVICLISCIYLYDKYVVPIVMYHKVEYSDQRRSDTVSPEMLERHLRYIKEKGYQVITLDDFVTGLQRGKKFNRKSVVLTFDDGYENNYTNAFPVIQKYKYPVTIFISPGFIGKENFLTWNQVLTMKKHKVFFGSHGMTQEYLPNIPKEEILFEIIDSKQILEEVLGYSVDYFAYPVGGFSEDIKKDIKDNGYKAAFTTNRGNDKLNKDLFEVNRVKLSDSDNSDIILWAKLSGYYNFFRKLKKPY